MPYYIWDLTRDPNFENQPKKFLGSKKQALVSTSWLKNLSRQVGTLIQKQLPQPILTMNPDIEFVGNPTEKWALVLAVGLGVLHAEAIVWDQQEYLLAVPCGLYYSTTTR